MPLQTYKDYTVDYRLRQFRRCKGGWENHGVIEFIDFKSEEGDQLLAEMLEQGLVPDEHLWRLI
jgi:hypothetical protein